MSKAVVVVQFVILAFGNKTEEDHEQPQSWLLRLEPGPQDNLLSFPHTNSATVSQIIPWLLPAKSFLIH